METCLSGSSQNRKNERKKENEAQKSRRATCSTWERSSKTRDETVEYVCEITEFHLFPLIDSKSKLNFKRKDGVIDVVYDMETGCSLFFNF